MTILQVDVRLIIASVCVKSEFGYDPVDLEKRVTLPFIPVPGITIDGIRYKECEYSTETGAFTLVSYTTILNKVPEGFTRTFDWE
jgi:predicted molibdopterin-dependent oxidoreductase YjgC